MMHGHSEDINLSQVSIYGLHYNRPSSDADDLNLYVYFEVDGETASTSTIKGLPGSSVEWPSDNIHFKRKHSTSHPLQVCTPAGLLSWSQITLRRASSDLAGGISCSGQVGFSPVSTGLAQTAGCWAPADSCSVGLL